VILSDGDSYASTLMRISEVQFRVYTHQRSHIRRFWQSITSSEFGKKMKEACCCRVREAAVAGFRVERGSQSGTLYVAWPKEAHEAQSVPPRVYAERRHEGVRAGLPIHASPEQLGGIGTCRPVGRDDETSRCR
jgi:hypothetical protein